MLCFLSINIVLAVLFNVITSISNSLLRVEVSETLPVIDKKMLAVPQMYTEWSWFFFRLPSWWLQKDHAFLDYKIFYLVPSNNQPDSHIWNCIDFPRVNRNVNIQFYGKDLNNNVLSNIKLSKLWNITKLIYVFLFI